jgi:hypothetical protein
MDVAEAPPTAGLPADLRDRFVARRDGRRSALVRADFAPAFDAAGLLDATSLGPEALVARLAGASPSEPREGAARAGAAAERAARLLPTASGRGPVAVIPAGPLGAAVVRLYRRGGLARRFSRRRYLLGRRAQRELVVTERLRRRGVPVVEALACVREELRPGYRAALVTRFVEGARPAGELLGERPTEGAAGGGAPAAAPGAASLMGALGRTTALLHAAGGWHADLHADNFLVLRAPESRGAAGGEGEAARDGVSAADATGLPLLVDLDRGRLLPFPVPVVAGRWSLRRLARHLRKRGLSAALGAMEELEAAYLEARRG